MVHWVMRQCCHDYKYVLRVLHSNSSSSENSPRQAWTSQFSSRRHQTAISDKKWNKTWTLNPYNLVCKIHVNMSINLLKQLFNNLILHISRFIAHKKQNRSQLVAIRYHTKKWDQLSHYMNEWMAHLWKWQEIWQNERMQGDSFEKCLGAWVA